MILDKGGSKVNLNKILLTIFVIFIAFNLFLIIDIFKPLESDLSAEKVLITKVYTGNKALELTAKLDIEKNKDVPLEYIDFNSAQKAIIIYEDNSTDEGFVRIRNQKTFLNNVDKVNLRLLISNFDGDKDVKAVEFELLSSISSYHNETSKDTNYLYLPLNTYNELREDEVAGSIDLKLIQNIDRLELLGSLGQETSETPEGLVSLLEDNLLLYLNGEKMYSVNLRSGENKLEKELGVFFSQGYLDNQQNNPLNNNLVAVGNSVFFTTDLGFVVTYDITTSTAFKLSNNVFSNSGTRNIESFKNLVISSFDNNLVFRNLEGEFELLANNEIALDFENTITDLHVEDDELYIASEAKTVVVSIPNLVTELNKVKANSIRFGLLNLETRELPGTQQVMSSMHFRVNDQAHTLVNGELEEQNYEYKINDLEFDFNSISWINSNGEKQSEEISLFPIQVIENSKGNFIINNANELYFVK